MEFAVHDWDDTPVAGRIGGADACGWILSINNRDRFEIYPERTTSGWSCCGTAQILLSTFPSKFAVIRAQVIPSGAGGTFSLEAWDANGTRVFARETSYTTTSGSNYSGAFLGLDNAAPMSYGFFRLSTQTVPVNSRAPVFADQGNLLEWKFDGNLSDASGRNYNGSISGGRASYVPTPNQQLVVAAPTMEGTPSWNQWVSARAGYPLNLDGTQSFSWGDGSPTTGCLWQVTKVPEGAPLPRVNNPQACKPVVTGLVFGTYTFRLTATSGASRVAKDLTLGAVAYDQNGVVIPSDPRTETLFGPMIAFGKNPWALADERSFAALNIRYNDYTLQGADGYSIGNPSWDTPQPGTVTYRFGGNVNFATGTPCTTLTSSASATATTISVADAGCLDLTTLPTRVMIAAGNFSSSFEEICISSSTATSGPATLSVCYDGRGVDDASNLPQILGPTDWSSGAVIGQQLVKGSGTQFATPQGAFCPAGAPGPAGQIHYQQGTVSLSAGSNILAGSGTTWTAANGVRTGDAIRVTATHGGQPFVFVAYVSAIVGPAQLTMSRAFPASADTADGLAYAIIEPFARFAALHFPRSDGSDAMASWTATACDSNDRLYLNTSIGGHDLEGYKGRVFSDQAYSYGYEGYINQSSSGGVNFYGESLAHRAFYLRSGFSKAREAANLLDDHWVRYPGERGGVVGAGSPLYRGGGVIAAISCLVLDASCKLTWGDVRGYIAQGAGIGSVTSCLDWDSRDGGYLGSWLALGALFDPDVSANGYRQRWRAALRQWEARDNACKRPDFSFANQATYFNTSGPQILLTNGSRNGTGSNLAAGICTGLSTGTATVVAGSATITVITGNFEAEAGGIILNGTKAGVPFSAHYLLQRGTATSGTLSVQWPGSSGTVSFMTTNGAIDSATVFATNTLDADLKYQHGCIRVSDTQILLDRPWAGNTGNHSLYRFPGTGTSGYGQQPFMAAINTLHLQWGSPLDSELGTSFGSIRDGAVSWIRNQGYDPETRGVYYGRVFQFAESTGPGVAGFAWKVPGVVYGLGQTGSARAVAGEIQSTLRLYFASNGGSAAARSWGDDVYGGIWGNCALTKPGYTCDSNYVTGEVSDGSLHQGKWTGFFFGIGMAHQWPAVRVGGTEPARPRTISVGFNNPGAAKARAVVLAPSGAVASQACGDAACSFTVDDRQGAHWYKLQYLSPTDQVLSETDFELLNPAPTP